MDSSCYLKKSPRFNFRNGSSNVIKGDSRVSSVNGDTVKEY